MGRVRTFIAVDLQDTLRRKLAALQETLQETGAEVKWVEPDNLHLTLLFLGEVDERELPEVCRVVAEGCATVKPFTLAVEGVGCFGDPRRPRTLWAGLTAGREELIALHQTLERPLLDLGCYRREERAFNPHVTLGRGKSSRPDDDLAQALVKQKDWKGGTCEVRAIRVMSSELRSSGPVYAVLSTAKLRGAG